MSLDVTNLWIESELILVSLVPVKLHHIVTRVHQSESRCLGLVDNSISDDQLVFHVLWKAFKCDGFRVSFSNDNYLVLLIRVM
jgi:hypothetical protein